MEQMSKFYVVAGILNFLFFGLIAFSSFYTGTYQGHEPGLFSISVMAFCLAYLYPEFKENDERSRRIKEKGMFASYFFIIGYMVILMILFQVGLLHFNGYQAVSLVAALTIMTVFLSFVYYARRT
ncbi:hypothetical protein [Alteribacter aurantiacus]|uniref:hypothetical protein n=1 Tax=Alteribacter aurantiacus TaxID=254410 RepID=UPI00040543E1|nr:hypothetical protein [Alteribacter aurantiacus]